ncbi:MAG: MAPEG family protein [Spongiibacteraceae bacterium]
MNIPLFCVAALGFLTIALGFNVSMARASTRIIIGQPNDPSSRLFKAIRAHGNTTEYAPALMVVIYALSQRAVAGWVVWSMIGVTCSRYLIASGLLLSKTLEKPNPLRALGALGTYIFGLALCFALGIYAFAA